MERAYGEWSSPVGADEVAGETLEFGDVACVDGVVYWLERRPDEDGRGVVVRSPPPSDTAPNDADADRGDAGGQDADRGDAETADVTPAATDVRTLAHRYGGGAFAVGEELVYSRAADGRVCRLPTDGDGEPTPLTPEPPEDAAVWYADLTIGPDGDVYAVRERHHDATGTPVEESEAIDEPVAELVRIPRAGGVPTVLAAGHDFYSFPTPAPDDDRIAWTAWDHPQMPWDGTELYVARETPDGTRDERRVLGGPEESVFQPSWDGGDLYAVSDRTGWWNVYRVPTDGSEPTAVVNEPAEYGVPQWVFGLSTYVHHEDGIAAIRTADGEQRLGFLDDEFVDAHLPYTVHDYAHLVTDGETLAFHAGGPSTPRSVVRWTPGEEPVVLRQSASFSFSDDYFAEPEHFSFPTGEDGESEAYAYYYPPTNPDYEGPADDRPPLIVTVHGGPTSRVQPLADPSIAYVTSRGFAVVAVNYRGSTGHGRAYRDALDGEWGLRDTLDCAHVAHYLGEWGVVDPDRTAIRGGSAGGYATLAALAFFETFDAGASYFGVADPRALAEDTHKFESRYLDGLVGPLPEASETYEARAPVAHADRIDAPTLLLQGGEDQVVPPSQAEQMVDALVDTDTPYQYVLFPEERHGFESTEANRIALESELAFYAAVFDLDRDDVAAANLVRGRRDRRVPTEE